MLAFALDVALTPQRLGGEVRALDSVAPTRTAFMESAAAEGRRIRVGKWTPIRALPALAACAVVFGEDEPFFDNGTLDWASQRAFFARAVRGDFSRGSSGISQQLAKNLFLAPDRSPRRKAREYALAYAISHALTKTRQLELYVNVVEWGPEAWGIDRASNAYFGIDPELLTPTQAVILATVLPAPRQALKYALTAKGEARQNRIALKLWGARLLTDAEYGATLDRTALWRAAIRRGRSLEEAWRYVQLVTGPERSAEALSVSGARVALPQLCNARRRGL